MSLAKPVNPYHRCATCGTLVMDVAGPYDLCYLDCPWSYNDTRSRASVGAARSAYPCLTLTELQSLPIPDIMAPRSALAMWWTHPKIKDAIALAEHWGYTVVTTGLFTWVKVNPRLRHTWPAEQINLARDIYHGIGHYSAANTENVLLAMKGTPRLPRNSLSVSQVVVAPRARHSEKPAEVRRRLEVLFGPVRRLEMFARGPRPEGWDTWGNEAE